MKTEFENRVSVLAMEHYSKPLLGSASKSNDVRRDASVRESLRPLTQRIKKCHAGCVSNYNNNSKLL